MGTLRTCSSATCRPGKSPWPTAPPPAPAFCPAARSPAFVSSASYLPDADPICATQDVFLYDLQTGEVTLASGTAAGGGDGPSSAPVFSPDGRFLAFLSAAGNLTPN